MRNNRTLKFFILCWCLATNKKLTQAWDPRKKVRICIFFQLVEEANIVAKMLCFVIQFYLHYFYSRFVQENTY